MSGHKSREFGIVSTSDITLKDTATELKPSEIKHDILLLSVGQRFQKGDESALYDIVRKFWKVGQQRANKMEYVVAIAGQITRGVFKVDEQGWRPAEEYEGEYFERESLEINGAKLEKRRFFSGEEVTDPEITELYVGKTFKMTQNPVRYLYKDGTVVEETEN